MTGIKWFQSKNVKSGKKIGLFKQKFRSRRTNLVSKSHTSVVAQTWLDPLISVCFSCIVEWISPSGKVKVKEKMKPEEKGVPNRGVVKSAETRVRRT